MIKRKEGLILFLFDSFGKLCCFDNEMILNMKDFIFISYTELINKTEIFFVKIMCF